jgi:hypothetical protein
VENNPEKEEELSILVENDLQQEDVVMEPVEEKKILSYLKRDADA